MVFVQSPSASRANRREVSLHKQDLDATPGQPDIDLDIQSD